MEKLYASLIRWRKFCLERKQNVLLNSWVEGEVDEQQEHWIANYNIVHIRCDSVSSGKHQANEICYKIKIKKVWGRIK